MKDDSLVPVNEIWYHTVDEERIRWDDIFMVSNTYHEGKGVIVFDEPIVEIGEEAFRNCTSLCEVIIPSSVTEIGGRLFQVAPVCIR